jgi:predicted O-linked N-acetylglucosamine transferase (SPINDLY family)
MSSISAIERGTIFDGTCGFIFFMADHLTDPESARSGFTEKLYMLITFLLEDINDMLILQ